MPAGVTHPDPGEGPSAADGAGRNFDNSQTGNNNSTEQKSGLHAQHPYSSTRVRLVEKRFASSYPL